MRKQTLHIINPLSNPYGGSENRSLELFSICKRYGNTKLWTEEDSLPKEIRNREIRHIRPRRLQFPYKGNFLFVGTYFYIGRWLRFARPNRIIVLYNVPKVETLWNFLSRIKSLQSNCAIEVCFASQELKQLANLPGRVFPSPIDCKRFTPRKDNFFDKMKKPFVVGRHSRDVIEKHHPDDPHLYRRLAQHGIRVRIMGGTVLADQLKDVSGIELLPAGAERAEDFLRTLDCFIYRTSPEWVEPFGRVIMEAMCSGLPVLCSGLGGFNEVIQHGVNGIIFSNNDEAIENILMLRTSSSMYATLASAARETCERLYSDKALHEFARYAFIGGEE